MIDLSAVKNVLAVFAHPDDETLAAGGTLHKLRRFGADVHVVIPAVQDIPNLRTDCYNAVRELKIPAPSHVHFGSFRDNEMDGVTLLSVIRWLQPYFEEPPDLVLTHCPGCTNIDHRVVNEAVTVLTRPFENYHVPVLWCEVPSSTGYRRPTGFEPNFYVGLTREDVGAKVSAMYCYSTERRIAPHARAQSALRALATVRGSEAGFHYAEAFMLLRGFA